MDKDINKDQTKGGLCWLTVPKSEHTQTPELSSGKGVDNPVFSFEVTTPNYNDLVFPSAEQVEICDVHSAGSNISSPSPSALSVISSNTTFSSRSNPSGNHSLTVPTRSIGIRPLSRAEDSLHQRRLQLVPLSVRDEDDTVSQRGTAQDSVCPWDDDEQRRGSSLSGISSVVSERLLELRRKFSKRTETFKERTQRPSSPTSLSSESLVINTKPVDKSVSGRHSEEAISLTQTPKRRGMNWFLSGADGERDSLKKDLDVNCCNKFVAVLKRLLAILSGPKTIDPQGSINLTWLFIVMIAFLYNAVVIPLRFAFDDYVQHDQNIIYWLITDYSADLIYIVDIMVFEVRITFLDNGTVQADPKEMRKNYFNKLRFKFDLICLLPTDLFYLAMGSVFPLFRLNRLFKISAFWEFYERCDQAARNGHIIRVIQTISVMLYLIHVEACGYYFISRLENFSTTWTYHKGNYPAVSSYIRCFYVAAKTATSIGKNPIPTNNIEYIFMTVYWLSGVFVFALLIGQIRDIFEAAGLVKTNYRKMMDITLWYMQSLNLPSEMQNRVRMWFTYNWDQQKTLDENTLIESLPRKMRTDLAINVHFKTLSKVQLFQDCDNNLLYDLILKLQPVLYLPGDYICRKGEVGTEMYIVMSGQVQVVGGPNNDIVFATLHEGSVFGEISLMALAGGNRRTADVRSKGFSNIFMLSKADFEEAMADYPDAHELLRRRAKRLLNRNLKQVTKEDDLENDVEIIQERKPTPKLLRTVIKCMDSESIVTLALGNNKLKRNNKINPMEDHASKAHNGHIISSDVTKDGGETNSVDDVSDVRSDSRRKLFARSVSEIVDHTDDEYSSDCSDLNWPEKEIVGADAETCGVIPDSNQTTTSAHREGMTSSDSLLNNCDKQCELDKSNVFNAGQAESHIQVSYIDSKESKDLYNRHVASKNGTSPSLSVDETDTMGRSRALVPTAGVDNKAYVNSHSNSSLSDLQT